MRVFDELVGQAAVVAMLTESLRAGPGGDGARGMTHAWLFTGPPGCGRSVAARAFAAALECPDGGCGHCHSCQTVRSGTHPDVTVVVPEGLHLSIAEVRSLVARSARAPSVGPWQITVIEDADRIEERTSNTLLRALEEPPPRAVFLLCAPSTEDLLPTIRSRCRVVALRTPLVEDVTAMLVERDGVDPAVASFAALASGGHVGRARRLASDEEARRNRAAVLRIPTALGSVPAAVAAADVLVEAADAEAAGLSRARDASERAALEQALGVTSGRKPRGAAGALRELEDGQKSRATRMKRDAMDRALLDLASFYRDVLVGQLSGGPPPAPLCPDAGAAVDRVAARSTAAQTLDRLSAILAARKAIDDNVSVQLAATSLLLRLRG